jgi:hypothetical protein
MYYPEMKAGNAADLSFSSGRFKCVGITVRNTAASVLDILLEDKDGNAILNITVPQDDTKHLNFALPVDFSNGLSLPGSGAATTHVTIYRTRDL